MASNSSTLATIETAYKARVGAPTWGISTQSGNASATAFNIAHGSGAAPTKYWVTPMTDAAHAKRTVTVTATNIVVTYAVAPPSGTNNLQFRWGASRL